MKIIILISMLLILLSGCAPGMSMVSAPETPNVKIVPITPRLIYDQQVNAQRKINGTAIEKRSKDLLDYQYKIGPYDVLSIIVWDHPELTIPAGEFRSAEAAGHLVAENGTIFYPYVGAVQVAGKTVAEVRKMLTKLISRTITRPQLDVRVAAFRSQKAYVVGEVATPGLQPITDSPLTVVEAINNAGGVTENADMLNVTLSRDGVIYDINLQAMYEMGDTSQNFILENGDILQVPDTNLQKVFVLGEVASPSSYLMHKGRMTLSEALSDAGGVDRISSNPAKVFVIRGGAKTPEIFHLDAESPEALILGDQFKLRPRDVVYVETAGVTSWNRVISQLLPTTQLLENLSTIEFQSIRNR
jgi:polysaccharide export outer membrane protein